MKMKMGLGLGMGTMAVHSQSMVNEQIWVRRYKHATRGKSKFDQEQGGRKIQYMHHNEDVVSNSQLILASPVEIKAVTWQVVTANLRSSPIDNVNEPNR